MFSASKTAAPATAGGYQVSNSLRFRSSASAYSSRSVSVASNRRTWTFSAWVKRGALGATQMIFGTGALDNAILYFNSDDTLIFQFGVPFAKTNAVFRDPSAWYHIVLTLNTTATNQLDRLFLYVNGVQQTFSDITYPTLNTNYGINSATTHYIGTRSSLSQFLDGYMADINFIDGQALTPSSFGEYNVTTGVWSPKSYTGTYGTNGFKLSFSNGTSTTTLGYDSSGNGNNWTTNNISLTAGSTYDWMIDSPTPFAGTGNGVGNYAVWNPISHVVSAGSAGTCSDANLKFTAPASGSDLDTILSSMPLSGLTYYELQLGFVGSAGSYAFSIGVTQPTSSNVGYSALTVTAAYSGSGNTNGWNYRTSGSGWVSLSAFTPANGDVYSFAVDANSGKVWARTNGGSWVGGGDPVAGTSPTYTFPNTSALYACGMYMREQGNYVIVNFGQRPFAYTPPTGYKALNTYNLPTPTIQNGAGYMAATLWTGSGGSPRQISNVGFTPDLVWIKSRSAAYDALIFDTVRTAGKSLTPSSTSSEVTNNGNGYLSAFGTDGFTLTQGSSSILSVNENGTTYVGWQWKAGGTAVTNTAGSITSSVSANTTAGFSVVTYTGTGANATVGHGLGVAPSMIINKSRNAAQNWTVFHAGLANMTTAYVRLNTIDAAGTLGNAVATPTSTTFGISASTADTSTYVAYCFAAIAGYSAFGSYTGNGSADGPFVYCGFRPRWLLVKRTDVANSWVLMDSSRSSFNYADKILWPNLSDAEANGGTTTSIDFVSNGFKQRGVGASINASGGTYIYAAFAENPFNYSLAR